MGYDVHITRQKNWTNDNAELKIALQDWLDYVTQDISLDIDGTADAVTIDGEIFFHYHAGNIAVKNPNKEILAKMLTIADYFNARLQGDDEEIYIRLDNNEIIPIYDTDTEFTYIRFTAPQQEQTRNKSSLLQRGLVGLLKLFIPQANPDFDKKLDEVTTWLLECDPTTCLVNREIGTNKNNEVIMIMPYKKNYGYWIDNNLLLNDFIKTFNAETIDRATFEKYWYIFNTNR